MNNTWTLLKQTFLSLPEVPRYLVAGAGIACLGIVLGFVFGPFFPVAILLFVLGSAALGMFVYIVHEIWKGKF
jgi:zinc transporter ZupT